MAYKTLMECCNGEVNLEVEVLRLARRLKIFSADDLHVLDPSLEELGRDRRVYGAILHSLKDQGKIKFVSYIPSSRQMCHNRPVAQWQFIESDFKRQADALSNKLGKATKVTT